MLALNLTGGGLSPGVILRESPTLQSAGQTTSKPVAGGFQIDIFTELSLDGGQTWMPGDRPSHVTAAKQGVTAMRASTWGELKIMHR